MIQKKGGGENSSSCDYNVKKYTGCNINKTQVDLELSWIKENFMFQ